MQAGDSSPCRPEQIFPLHSRSFLREPRLGSAHREAGKPVPPNNRKLLMSWWGASITSAGSSQLAAGEGEAVGSLKEILQPSSKRVS